MFVQERHQAMAELIRSLGRMSVNDLSRQYSVSVETVRRDLCALGMQRRVKRVHGGAIAPELEAAPAEGTARSAQLDRVAAAAARLLPLDGATVLIEAGHTTTRLAQSIPRECRLDVITNSVPIASQLTARPRIGLHVLPGRVCRRTGAATGPRTMAALDAIHCDVGVLEVAGLGGDHGLWTSDPADAAVKAAVVHSARHLVVLLESDSIGVERDDRFAQLSMGDTLVVDRQPTTSARRSLETGGVAMVVA